MHRLAVVVAVLAQVGGSKSAECHAKPNPNATQNMNTILTMPPQFVSQVAAYTTPEENLPFPFPPTPTCPCIYGCDARVDGGVWMDVFVQHRRITRVNH